MSAALQPATCARGGLPPRSSRRVWRAFEPIARPVMRKPRRHPGPTQRTAPRKLIEPLTPRNDGPHRPISTTRRHHGPPPGTRWSSGAAAYSVRPGYGISRGDAGGSPPRDDALRTRRAPSQPPTPVCPRSLSVGAVRATGLQGRSHRSRRSGGVLRGDLHVGRRDRARVEIKMGDRLGASATPPQEDRVLEHRRRGWRHAIASAPTEPPPSTTKGDVGHAKGAGNASTVEQAIRQLAALFGIDAEDRGASGVDEGDQRQTEAPGAESMSRRPPQIALGPRHAEIVLDADRCRCPSRPSTARQTGRGNRPGRRPLGASSANFRSPASYVKS